MSPLVSVDGRELLHIAHAAAGAYLQRHPSMAHQADEILSDACLGAVSAAGRYDADGGASLRTFATRRASGAIVDGIRDRAPLRRGEYARAGEDAYELSVQRTPLPLELLMEVSAWQPGYTDAEFDRLERDEDRQATRGRLAQLLAVCSPLERIVLLAAVGAEVPATEVARRLKVSDGAVSQALKKGLQRIRSFLESPPEQFQQPVFRQSNRSFDELISVFPEVAQLSRGVTVDPTKEKIAAALKHENIAIRRAAQRANESLAKLDSALSEWDAKQAARERVAELQRALDEARAQLHGGKKKSIKTAVGDHAQARTWAQQRGIPVPHKGRVPNAVIEQWRSASERAA